jgi:AcrR family transcriptional regulator
VPPVENGGRRGDPRVERTRRHLEAAILDLACERELDDITVADIAARAQVNRATVYLHSKDRDSLLVAALESRIAQIATLAAAACPADRDSRETPAPLRELFAEFEQRKALFGRILGPGGSGKVKHRMQEVVRRHVLSQLPVEENTTGIAHETRAAFLSGALLGVVTHWLDTGTRTSGDELAGAVWRLLRSLT